MYAQFERVSDDAVFCSTCGEEVCKPGIRIGPIRNPDGTPYMNTNGAKSLLVQCSSGHETLFSLGDLGRIHLQHNPPSEQMPGIIAR